jgi:hypothetical protein
VLIRDSLEAGYVVRFTEKRSPQMATLYYVTTRTEGSFEASAPGPERRFSNVRLRAAPRVLADIGQASRSMSRWPGLPASSSPLRSAVDTRGSFCGP